MKLNARFNVSGHFTDVEVLDSFGRVTRHIKGPKNIITNIGLAQINVPNSTNLYSFCRVGTGNGTPLPTDTALQNQIASADENQAVYTQGVDLEGGFIWCRLVWTFGLGDVVGNIAELGTGWGASGAASLFSRALIRDSEGNPTSITLLSDEQLRVTWEHRRYWQVADSSGEIVNEGNKGGSYSWVIRPARITEWAVGGSDVEIRNRRGGQFAAWDAVDGNFVKAWGAGSVLGDISGVPSGGTEVSPSGFSIYELRPGPTSFVCGFRFSISQGNGVGGLKCFLFSTTAVGAVRAGSRVCFQAEITPAIPKTLDDYLELEFELSWGRYEPA